MSDGPGGVRTDGAGPVRVRADGAVRTGRALDLTDLDVDGRALVRAVREPAEPEDDGSAGPVVRCPEPTAVHRYVGHVHPGMGLPVRAALAAAARARGERAPQDGEIADLHAELDAIEPPAVELGPARRRLAGLDGPEIARLREEVAARRGALEARAALDAPVSPAEAALREAAGRLADRETDRHAARQALQAARERARASRDRRERRLRLEDRLGNRERAAREHLAGALRAEFAAALEAVPGDGRLPGRPASYEGPPDVAALAVARLAPVRAPLVLEVDRFATAADAAARLDAPVVLV